MRKLNIGLKNSKANENKRRKENWVRPPTVGERVRTTKRFTVDLRKQRKTADGREDDSRNGKRGEYSMHLEENAKGFAGCTFTEQSTGEAEVKTEF